MSPPRKGMLAMKPDTTRNGKMPKAKGHRLDLPRDCAIPVHKKQPKPAPTRSVQPPAVPIGTAIRNLEERKLELLKFQPTERNRLGELPREVRDIIFDYVFDGAFVAIYPYRAWSTYKWLLKSTPKTLAEGTRFQDKALEILAGGRKEIIVPNVFHKGEPVPVLKPRVDIDWGDPDDEAHRQCDIAVAKRREANLGLLFTCHKFLTEFSESIYPKLIFALGSVQAVGTFLGERRPRGTPKPDKAIPLGCDFVSQPIRQHGHAYIKTLCLEILAYGESANVENFRFRDKYYRAWKKRCRLIVKKLPNLQTLSLSIHVPTDFDGKLSFDEKWIKPALEFCKAERLKNVAVELRTDAQPQHCKQTLTAFAAAIVEKLKGGSITDIVREVKFWKWYCDEEDEVARQKDPYAVFENPRDKWKMLGRWNGIVFETSSLV